MISRINEAKTLVKLISCNYKHTHKKNGVMKHVNVSVKIIVRAKKDYSCNPSTCICE